MRSTIFGLMFGVWLLVPLVAHAQQEEEVKSLTSMIKGNDVFVANKRFKSGNEWLALSCNAKQCALEPATLKVSKAQWKGHYDERSTPGVNLKFRRTAPSQLTPILWIRKTPRLPWLKVGGVVSYASSIGGVTPAKGEGTLEIEIQRSSSATSRLLPLLHQQDAKFLLQLREGQYRQMLVELGRCTHELSLQYLQWAGDIDGDGRTDYLIDSIAETDSSVLYLSSLAGADQLVGVAAVAISTPYGGECDGNGWLEWKN